MWGYNLILIGSRAHTFQDCIKMNVGPEINAAAAAAMQSHKHMYDKLQSKHMQKSFIRNIQIQFRFKNTAPNESRIYFHIIIGRALDIL